MHDYALYLAIGTAIVIANHFQKPIMSEYRHLKSILGKKVLTN